MAKSPFELLTKSKKNVKLLGKIIFEGVHYGRKKSGYDGKARIVV